MTPLRQAGLIGRTFAGRKVLLTGHTGFKGAWMAMWLHHLGARVTGFSLAPPTCPSLYDDAGVADMVADDRRGDIRDLAAVRCAVDDTEPDVVFHMAAQPLVREAFQNPAETFDVNLMGTVNVLEAVRRARRPCVVMIITTDKCYENHGTARPFLEEDRLGGTEAYGASKAAAELAVEAYRHTYFHPARVDDHGIRVASVRAGNVIGGGDWAASRLVPDIVRALSREVPVEVRFPEAIRPWQHVAVPLSGYLHLATAMLEERISPEVACAGWNFGPRSDDIVPVGRLVEQAIRIWGGGHWTPAADALRSHEASVLRLDVTRAERLLGWVPAWDFSESLERTLSWYRWSHDHPRDPHGLQDLCLADITAYETAAGWERPSTASAPA